MNFRKICWYFVFSQTSPIWGYWYINILAGFVNRCITYDNSIKKFKINNDNKLVNSKHTYFEILLINSNYDCWLLVFGLGFTYLYKPILASILIFEHLYKKGLY